MSREIRAKIKLTSQKLSSNSSVKFIQQLHMIAIQTVQLYSYTS